PEVGATVASVDEASIRDIPGVIEVVVRKNFVGIVAQKQYQAALAADQLKVKWTPGARLPNQNNFYEYMRKQASRDEMMVNSKDVDQKLASAAVVLQATYAYPYQEHASIGASCAVADVRGDNVTVWSPTQSVYPTRSCVAMLL